MKRMTPAVRKMIALVKVGWMCGLLSGSSPKKITYKYDCDAEKWQSSWKDWVTAVELQSSRYCQVLVTWYDFWLRTRAYAGAISVCRCNGLAFAYRSVPGSKSAHLLKLRATQRMFQAIIGYGFHCAIQPKQYCSNILISWSLLKEVWTLWESDSGTSWWMVTRLRISSSVIFLSFQLSVGTICWIAR